MNTLSKMRDLDTLLPILAERRDRTHDVLVPVKDVSAIVRDHVFMSEDGLSSRFDLAISHPDGLAFDLTRPALSQLCTRISEGSRQDLPARYLDTLLMKGNDGNQRAAELARENVGFWLDLVRGEVHNNGQERQWFVRLVSSKPIELGEDGLPTNADLTARAVLTDKYFAIDDLDLIGTVVEVIRDYGSGYNPAAGVQCIDWRNSETKLDLLFVNPRISFDLKNPDAGVQVGKYQTQQDAIGHFVSLKGNEGGQHLVFPAARITNSESGHGGVQANAGAFEKVCFNKAMIGTNMVKRHLGALMDGSSRSVETREARRHAILCEIKDAVRAVFDPSTFETLCKEFLGLFKYEVSAVKPVIENVVRTTKLPTAIIDDIMMAYTPLGDRHTLGDIQRAVTNVATKEGCGVDLARDLEDAGGSLIKMTDKQLARLLIV